MASLHGGKTWRRRRQDLTTSRPTLAVAAATGFRYLKVRNAPVMRRELHAGASSIAMAQCVASQSAESNAPRPHVDRAR